MFVLLVRVTQFDLHHLGELDGLSEWREREAADLSALVQGRLHALQNPPDCNTARKLTCNLNKGSLNCITRSNVEFYSMCKISNILYMMPDVH